MKKKPVAIFSKEHHKAMASFNSHLDFYAPEKVHRQLHIMCAKQGVKKGRYIAAAVAEKLERDKSK